MADNDDLSRLNEGDSDLTHCDFTGANLSDLDLSKRDFSNSLFGRASTKGTNFSGSKFVRANLSQVDAERASFVSADLENAVCISANFRASDLRDSSFKGTNLNLSDFTGADLRGANFTNVEIMRGAKFDNAKYDDTTIFNGAHVMRAVSRDSIFDNYTFDAGRLRPKDTGRQVEDLIPPQSTETAASRDDTVVETIKDKARVVQRVSQYPDEASIMASSLADAIGEELGRLANEIPNDPEKYEFHQRYFDFLKKLRIGMEAIAASIRATQQKQIRAPDEQDYSRASEKILALRTEVGQWLDQNLGRVVDYGFRVSLLGVGTSFLTICGAPAWPAFIASALILEGKNASNAARADK